MKLGAYIHLKCCEELNTHSRTPLVVHAVNFWIYLFRNGRVWRDFRISSPAFHWTPVFSVAHIRVSTGRYRFYFQGLKALDSRQLNYTKMATEGEEGWRKLKQSKWRKTVIQLRAKPSSVGIAVSRDEAILRYQANPKDHKEAHLPGSKASRVRLPAFSWLIVPRGPQSRWQKLPDRHGWK